MENKAKQTGYIPVTITGKALERIRAIMESKEVPDGYGLRIGVDTSGCGAVSHLLGFDTRKEDDECYDQEGVPVYIKKLHVLYLAGMMLDFVEDDEKSGFTFVKRKL